MDIDAPSRQTESRHGTNHPDHASDQISNQSNIQKQRNLWQILMDVQIDNKG